MKAIIFLSCLLIHLNSFGQNNHNYFLVNLATNEQSFLAKDENKELSDLFIKKMGFLCESIKGVIIDEQSDYLLVNDLFITSVKSSNSGFLPIINCKINLVIRLKYKLSKSSFKNLTISKEYSGNSEKECIINFINDLTIKSDELETFFNAGFEEMKSYYFSNCQAIIQNVKKYQSIGNLDKAIAICLTVPENVACYSQVNLLTKSLFTAISYQVDYKIFLGAQNYVVAGDFESALSILKDISIYSNFYTESIKMSENISTYIMTKNELEKKNEIASKNIELQKVKNELQESINRTNIQITEEKNDAERVITQMKLSTTIELKSKELKSKENIELMKVAGSFLNAYTSRPSEPRYYQYYIIK